MNAISAVFHSDGSLPVVLGSPAAGAAHAVAGTPLLASDQGVYHAPSPGDRVMLVCDARIDNRRELLAQLDEQPAAEDGPAGLIAAAWRKWGPDCALHLIGDFAFILWDARAQTLFAARDAMGIRPLYYTAGKGFICLASSPRTLLAHPAVTGALSQTALLMWVLNRYEDDVSMFEGVHGLSRGHRLLATRQETSVASYWDFSRVSRLRYTREEEYHAHFREILARCVADRCTTAGPLVAGMLSGGMDSSSVMAMARRACNSTGREAVAYAFQFKRLKTCDESALSRTIADHLDIPCEWVDCERFWPLQGAFTDRARLDTPFRCWDPLNNHIFSRVAERGGDLLLTGHGGDALMVGIGNIRLLASRLRAGHPGSAGPLLAAIRQGGHPLLPALYQHLLLPLVPDALTRLAKRASGWTSGRYPWVPRALYRRLRLNDRFFAPPPTHPDDRERGMLLQIISQGAFGVRRAIHLLDRLALPFGIQVRHPFFDRRLAEFMLAIPVEMIRFHSEYVGQKGFLRKSMKGLLPDSTLAFSSKISLSPYYHYGIGRERDNIAALVAESPLARMGLIDGHLLRKAIEAYLARSPHAGNVSFFTTLLTDIWLKNEKDATIC